ncbi:MAG: hypothetical protein M1834_005476 [Cirrosporium novae-zelandiae]|nr:MAG: hypothetical protein M1834_005476 [Cirrosporium novae-zelandiae]
MFNLPGITSTIKALVQSPNQVLPHVTVPTLLSLQVPLIVPLTSVRALVLDKDNCITVPHAQEIYPPLVDKLHELQQKYHVVLLSNTLGLGTSSSSITTFHGIPVLPHTYQKPHPSLLPQVLSYFRSLPSSPDKPVPTHPSHIAFVGDRLFTDILLANSMGAYGIWVRDGIAEGGKYNNIWAGMERQVKTWIERKGRKAPEVNQLNDEKQ